MARHIHIHLRRGPARDAGTAHDPGNGQFTSGSNGGSGTVVKHQPSGTTVPHQAKSPPKSPPKSESIPGGHRVTYTEEHHNALKDVLPPARAQALAKSGTTNLSYEQHEQMMKRHFS